MAPNRSELIKQQAGNPFSIIETIRRASTGGAELSEDELFLCKWYGLYTHRHEPGYFMLRTKQPNGYVTVEQAKAVARIAERRNKGFVDITTRQDFQLHWCHLRDVPAILDELKAAGITTQGACGDVMRNVVGCPVAGVDRDEVLDAGPVAQQIHELFTGNLKYADLPRKYKVCVTGCRSLCPHPEIHCVSFVGCEQQTAEGKTLGFDVRVGGGLSTQAFFAQRLNAFVRPEQVIEILQAITDIWQGSPVYREKRHHARFKYLIHDWGVEKFRQVLEERLGRALEPAAPSYQEAPDRYRDHVGVHAQKQDGYFYVGVPILVGRITSAQLKRAAELSERYADLSIASFGTPLRVTSRQNLVLLHIPEARVENVLAGLADVELSVNAHPISRGAVTCTGTEFCKLAITETKARTRQIVEYLEHRVLLDEPLRLHITGCPNACAQYQIAHIGLMGSKAKRDGQVVDAYDILVGGQMGAEASFNHAIVRKVPATECARRLEQLLLGFKRERRPQEPFNAWCRRAGDARLVELLTDGEPHPMEDVPSAPVPERDEPAL